MDYEALADSMSTPSDLLEVVAQLADRQVQLEEQIAYQTSVLQDLNKALLRVSSIELPNAMQSAGLVSVGLKDGSSIKIESGVATSITAATHDSAIQWLSSNGFGDLVKRTVSVNFKREDAAKHQVLVDLLEREGFQEYSVSENVHPQTLKAFVNEQVKKGAPPPADTFNLFPYTKTKVVRPKK